MNFIRAEQKHLEIAEHIVRTSIETSYPPCYPKEVVDFFLNAIHTRKNIARDINAGAMWLMEENGVLFGTGCIRGEEITRVYFLPEYQGKGYGSQMMDFLEGKAAGTSVKVSPSLPAEHFYQKRGYVLLSHEDCPLENGVILSHDIMQKQRKSSITPSSVNYK